MALGWTPKVHRDRAFRAAQDASLAFEHAARNATRRSCNDAMERLIAGGRHSGKAEVNYAGAGAAGKVQLREVALRRDDAEEAFKAYCMIGGDPSKLPAKGWRLPLSGSRRRRRRR